MHILLITQEPPLRHDAVATGNAIRTSQLEGALRNAGHDISQTWLSQPGQNDPVLANRLLGMHTRFNSA